MSDSVVIYQHAIFIFRLRIFLLTLDNHIKEKEEECKQNSPTTVTSTGLNATQPEDVLCFVDAVVAFTNSLSTNACGEQAHT